MNKCSKEIWEKIFFKFIIDFWLTREIEFLQLAIMMECQCNTKIYDNWKKKKDKHAKISLRGNLEKEWNSKWLQYNIKQSSKEHGLFSGWQLMAQTWNVCCLAELKKIIYDFFEEEKWISMQFELKKNIYKNSVLLFKERKI